MSADELKAKGNEAFTNKRFEEAIDFFSKAIELNPQNHVLFSNRSAAKASLKDFAGALEDAKNVVELKPDWAKGYSRLGAAHYGLRAYQEALEACQKGIAIDPSNAALLELKQGIEKDMTPPNKSPFASPEVLQRLLTNPKTSPLMVQPDFQMMLRDLQMSPQNMMKYMNDPRMQLLMEVGLGLDLSGAADHAETGDNAPPHVAAKQEEAVEGKTESQEPKTEASVQEKGKEGEGNAQHKEALKEKEAGNMAYKKRQFPEAIKHYTKALELYQDDITFLTNRAAVCFEMGDYEKCIEDCQQAESHGRKIHVDFKLIAKAITRKGKALVKLDRLEEAIDVFNRSLTEHRNADTLKALQTTEKALKERKEKEYIDMELSMKEKEAGNEAVKIQDYPEAVKYYTEALKRGPSEVNEEAYKLYSNRANCYTKLGAWSDGLKDAEKCIELKSDFWRGYARKGHIQFLLKEYEKAVETYKQGLEIEPDNAELKEGIQKCVQQISRFARGEATEAEMQERRSRAMADPEIQQILTDPVMAQILKDFEADPRGAQKHLQNPDIMTKLNKLITAGIIKIQ